MARALAVLLVAASLGVSSAAELVDRTCVAVPAGPMPVAGAALVWGKGYVVAYVTVCLLGASWYVAVLLTLIVDALYGRLRAWASSVR